APALRENGAAGGTPGDGATAAQRVLAAWERAEIERRALLTKIAERGAAREKTSAVARIPQKMRGARPADPYPRSSEFHDVEDRRARNLLLGLGGFCLLEFAGSIRERRRRKRW